jgi:DNA-binding transcriptional ArsR family regulator
MDKIECKKIPDKVFKAIVRDEIAKIGSALSDPNRVAILDILSQGEQNVEQIVHAVKSTKGTVSHHLQILKTANLVTSRKESRYVFYSMPQASLDIWQALNLNSQTLSDKIMCAVNTFFEKSHEFTNVDYSELQNRVQSGEVILIDVRPELEFSQGHFPGALSVPLESLKNRINELPSDKKIIAYCRGPLCILAENAVNMLRSNAREAYRWKESILDWAEYGVKIQTG